MSVNVADKNRKVRITNADRVRAMTDEQLAEIIVCQYPEGRDGGCFGLQCEDCCLDWLKQSAEVE